MQKECLPADMSSPKSLEKKSRHDSVRDETYAARVVAHGAVACVVVVFRTLGYIDRGRKTHGDSEVRWNQLTSSWSVSRNGRNVAPNSRSALADDRTWLIDSLIVWIPLTVRSD